MLAPCFALVAHTRLSAKAWVSEGDEVGRTGDHEAEAIPEMISTASVTSISATARHPGDSDADQLPSCYIRPAAKLAVKPTNWWLQSSLDGAPTRRPVATENSCEIGRGNRITRRCAPRPSGAAGPKPPTFNLAFSQVVEPACLMSQVRPEWQYRCRIAMEQFLKLVGATGFEPATLWSQTRCATRLRHAPSQPASASRVGAMIVSRFAGRRTRAGTRWRSIADFLPLMACIRPLAARTAVA
jgi:hypothetical protein